MLVCCIESSGEHAGIVNEMFYVLYLLCGQSRVVMKMNQATSKSMEAMCPESM